MVRPIFIPHDLDSFHATMKIIDENDSSNVSANDCVFIVVCDKKSKCTIQTGLWLIVPNFSSCDLNLLSWVEHITYDKWLYIIKLCKPFVMFSTYLFCCLCRLTSPNLLC